MNDDHGLATKHYGLHLNVTGANCNNEVPPAPKSPVTIQDWINSIEFSQSRGDDDLASQSAKEVNEVEDLLKLGDEAQHLQAPATRHVLPEMDTSMQAVLAALAYDPEDVLLNLGLGDDSNDPLMRIPPRFLNDSKLCGDLLEIFLRKQYEICELVDAGHCGYRGLSGYKTDSPRFSGIVLKCLHRIRDATRNLERSLTTPSLTVTQPSSNMSFFRAVYSVLAVNTFRNSIQRDSSSTNSILEPENKAFLDSQSRRRRRQRGKLILEKNSVALDADEDVFSDNTDELEMEPEPIVSPLKDFDSPKISSAWDRLRKARFDREAFANHLSVDSDAADAQLPDHNRKKHLRIQRQQSVDEDRSSDQESLIQPKIKLNKPTALAKLSGDINKDSFELEELSVNDDQGNDDEIACSSDRSLFVKCDDILRTESAISDSSGFLDGEVLDATGCVHLDDSPVGFHPIVESPSAYLKSELYYSNEDNYYEDGEAAGENVEELNFETIGEINVEECITSDSPTEMATDSEIHISEVNTEVSSDEANSKEELSFHQTSLISSSLIQLNDISKNRDEMTNLDKGVSTSALDLSQYKIYFSPFSRHNWLETYSGSLQSLSETNYSVSKSDHVRISDKKWPSPWRDCHRVRHQPRVTTTQQVQEFHKGCMSVIDNMQYVIQSYAKKLQMMERMCWESYHSLFPGISSDERRELENLSELRRLILSEAKKTKDLLNKKTNSVQSVQRSTQSSPPQCDLRIVDAAFEMQELVRQQDQLMLQLKEPTGMSITIGEKGRCSPEISQIRHQETEVEKAVAKGKNELLKEIKQIMESDNETFLDQLLATRREIEDLKSLWSSFLSSTGDN